MSWKETRSRQGGGQHDLARFVPISAGAGPSGNAGVILVAGVYYVDDTRHANPDAYAVTGALGGFAVDTAALPAAGLPVNLTALVAYIG